LPSGASLELAQVAQLSREVGAPILCGANATQARRGDQPGGLRNTAMLVDPDGRVQWSAKNRLVPFGEKAPLGDQIPFLKNLAPQPEVLAAPEPQVLSLRLASGDQITIGAVICFESCFPAPATVMARRGARALFVLTNDEWFNGTDAPGEHAAMCALRAVENRLPVAQAANGGYAAAVDANGRFVVLGQYGVPGTVEARLPISP
jgi:apolipoprotein N-acyltransferase